MAVFWDIALCSLVDTARRFGGAHRIMYEDYVTYLEILWTLALS
jgi:hypothetical protein